MRTWKKLLLERKGFMKVQTEKGVITVSSDVFTNITGAEIGRASCRERV